MTESFQKNAILELFNIDRSRVKEVDCHSEGDVMYVDLLLVPDYPPCPDCGCEKVQIKEYVLKRIKHSVLTDRKFIVRLKARRYVCPVCHRTYYEYNPMCFTNRNISTLTVTNILKDLKEPAETFSAIGRRYKVSANTVASILDHHIIEPRRELPELMCWDEAYAFHHKGENSKYVFTMLDYETIEPVDILPSRRMEYLKSYFLKIPEEERKKVKMIATDMYEEYRSIIRSLFRTAYHSVDHYHVSQEMHRKLDRIRIKVMKSVPKYLPDSKVTTNEYYLLKTFNWMLFKRPDTMTKEGYLLFDPDAPRKMNRKLNRWLNYYDIRILIENIDPSLREAWDLKDSLVDFYDVNTYETAPAALKELIRELSSSSVKEMNEFARTLRRWQEEIINSFIVVKHRYKVDKDTGQVTVSEIKLNNGLMENRNSVIKTLKKAANGYSNWERFRTRCLYVLRKSSIPRLLNPVIPKKEKT